MAAAVFLLILATALELAVIPTPALTIPQPPPGLRFSTLLTLYAAIILLSLALLIPVRDRNKPVK
jgi:hypothetical protein